MRIIQTTMAVSTLLVSLGMAGVSAWQRSATKLDGALMMALAFVVVAAVHFLPALSKRRMMWPLWAGCFLTALYGHAGFFAFANTKNGEARAVQSVEAKAVQAQRQTIAATIDSISARPTAMVAKQVSRTHDSDKRKALGVELEEAKRAAGLRDELVRLDAVTASHLYVTDPVVMQLVTVTGASERSVLLVINLVMAGIVELIGAMLWRELVTTEGKTLSTVDVTDAQTKPPTQPSGLDALRAAVTDGRCRATVKGVREFMGCSQARAMELRRQLIA